MSDSETPAIQEVLSQSKSTGKGYWLKIVMEWLLLVLIIGGLEAICILDWRSLFYATILLILCRAYVGVLRRMLPRRALLRIVITVCVVLFILVPLFILHSLIWMGVVAQINRS